MAAERKRARRRRRRRGRSWPVAIGVLAVVAVLAVWLGPDLWERFAGPPPEEVAAPAPAQETPAPAREPFRPPPVAADDAPEGAAQPDVSLPPLPESDPLVREQVAPLSPDTPLPRWLDRDGLVNRFVVSVDNVADGASPRKHLVFLKPTGSFLVLGEGETLRTDPASYRRYDQVVEVVASLDPEACARIYRRLYPLFQESYTRLGYPEDAFHDRFAEALRELLRTPVPPRAPALERRVKRYVYRDPALEGLSDVQKQLLRMGPEGVRTVQAKLREIAAVLGIETP